MIASVAFFLSGCAALPKPPRDESPSSITAIKAKAKIVRVKKNAQPEEPDAGGRAVIFLKKPDIVRIEVLGPLNRIVMVVAGTSDSCQRYFNGEITPCGWEDSSLAYSFNPKELVPVMLGENTFEDKTGGLSIISDSAGTIVKLVKLNEKEEAVSLEIRDYKTIGNFRLPSSFVIENKNETVFIDYTDIEINPMEINDGLLSLPVSN